MNTNYWLDPAPVFPPAATAWPRRADVAVIGAGFTGLAAALRLARHGARVVVLEARDVGWGASTRNGGMVLHGLKLGARALLQRYGRDLAQRLFQASVQAVSEVERLVQQETIACHFARCGHAELAYKPAHYPALQDEAETLATHFGHAARVIPRADLGAVIDSPLYHGALVDEASAGLHPAQFTAGLAQAAQKAGAQLWPQTAVTGVQRVAGGFVTLTTRGPLTVNHVAAASGGYTSRAIPALHKRLIPIGSYIIATEPLPPALASRLIPGGRMLYDTKNFLYYFRLTPDNRVLFGGRAGFFPETPATVQESAAILRQSLLTVYPQLRGVRVTHAWGGTLDFALDMMPHAGLLEGLAFAGGYAGTGVALATYLGGLLGDLLAGQPRDNPFAELPFDPIPLYNGIPWFLPLAGAWFRALDAVG